MWPKPLVRYALLIVRRSGGADLIQPLRPLIDGKCSILHQFGELGKEIFYGSQG
jgi:hypothetical protein